MLKILKDLVCDMCGIDLCLFVIYIVYGYIVQWFMSNNGEVEYDGNLYFFIWKDLCIVYDIEKDVKVSFGFQGKGGLFVVVEGYVIVIEYCFIMQLYWMFDLDQWFEQGLEMLGICMIWVEVMCIVYW